MIHKYPESQNEKLRCKLCLLHGTNLNTIV